MPDEERPTAGGRSASFFDLDKTVIAKSSALAFSRPFYDEGLINRRSVLRSAYAQFVFHLGGADHEQMAKLRAMLSRMVTGWDVAVVREVVEETLHHVVDPLVFDEAVSLIEGHHREGRDVIIVSASASIMVEPIGAMLGADAVVATRLQSSEGRFTGDIEFYAYADQKAAAMRDIALERGYDLAASYAYSDSITDLPMLEVVGHPHAVNPDRELRRVAHERGWPVLVFDRPVALRPRMHLPEGRTTLAALAAGTAAVIGSAVYLGSRKRLGGGTSSPH